jgi:hypothetical protein
MQYRVVIETKNIKSINNLSLLTHFTFIMIKIQIFNYRIYFDQRLPIIFFMIIK